MQGSGFFLRNSEFIRASSLSRTKMPNTFGRFGGVSDGLVHAHERCVTQHALEPDRSRQAGAAYSPAVRCVVSLSTKLLSYGLPVHRVEESVVRLADAFQQRATVMALPTTISITLSGQEDTTFHMVRGAPSSIHLGRLSALHELVGSVERGELDAQGALCRIELITNNLGEPHPLRKLACAGLVGAGGARLLGGETADSWCAGGLAMGVAALAMAASRNAEITRVEPVIAATCVTLACSALAHASIIPHPLIVTLSALLVLLPGLTLTLAAVELGTGHLVCGSARLVGAAMTFMQLGFGVLLGVRLGALSALTPVAPAQPAAWLEALGAAALAVGFCGLLSVSRRDAWLTGVVCSFAWLASRMLGAWQGPEPALLLAAIGVGLFSNVFARVKARPSNVLLVPGISMLVPGSLGLLSISSALLHDPQRAWTALAHLLALTMALSTGVLVAAALAPPRTERDAGLAR